MKLINKTKNYTDAYVQQVVNEGKYLDGIQMINSRGEDVALYNVEMPNGVKLLVNRVNNEIRMIVA